MNSLTISLIVLVCVFGSALLGFYLRKALPEGHLGDDTLRSVTLTTGMIATLSSLVLGLLISSTQASFNSLSTELRQVAAKTVLLDRTLSNYGPQTRESRDLLRQIYASSIEFMFSVKDNDLSKLDTSKRLVRSEKFQAMLRELTPQNDSQRSLQARALQLSDDLAESRWELIEQNKGAISTPFLVVLVLWLCIIFVGFGMLTANNETVFLTLFLCALSVSSAIFLILELGTPFEGLMKISSTPMLNAFAHLGVN
jgi:hypothetical protein